MAQPLANGKTMGHREVVAERRQRVFKLRQTGADEKSIAMLVGASVATVSHDLQVVLKQYAEKLDGITAELRAQDSARLDRLLSASWAKAIGYTDAATGEKVEPDMDAVRICLKILQQRATLLGLNVPVQATMDVNVNYDWQSEARAKGLPAAKIAEELIQQYMRQLEAKNPTPAIDAQSAIDAVIVSDDSAAQ